MNIKNKCIPELKIEYSVTIEKRLTKLESFTLANIIEFNKPYMKSEADRTLSDIFAHFYGYMNLEETCKVVLKNLYEKKLIKCNKINNILDLPIRNITISQDLKNNIYDVDNNKSFYYLDGATNELRMASNSDKQIICCSASMCPFFKNKQDAIRQRITDKIKKEFANDFIKNISIDKMTACLLFEKEEVTVIQPTLEDMIG